MYIDVRTSRSWSRRGLRVYRFTDACFGNVLDIGTLGNLRSYKYHIRFDKARNRQSAERGARGDPDGSFDGALEAAQDVHRLAAGIR